MTEDIVVKDNDGNIINYEETWVWRDGVPIKKIVKEGNADDLKNKLTEKEKEIFIRSVENQ